MTRPPTANRGPEVSLAADSHGTAAPDSFRAPDQFSAFLFDLHRRRRICRLLDEKLADLYPPPAVDPASDFGLNPDELRAEARRLHAAGWSVQEITQRLAVSRP